MTEFLILLLCGFGVPISVVWGLYCENNLNNLYNSRVGNCLGMIFGQLIIPTVLLAGFIWNLCRIL